ncbi:hypothetical protein AB3M80_23125 [Arthrospira platensis BEA 1257B]
MSRLRKILAGAGIATVGAIGTKMAVDYFRNRNKEEVVDETEDDVEEEELPAEQVSYAVVQDDSLQEFLDAAFGAPGRYVPTRPSKVFSYHGEEYMVVWTYDNDKSKNQMLAFKYTDVGRKMIASVGYTSEKTDYNLTGLDQTEFAIEVNGEKITSGQGETDGTDDVDFVPVTA